MIPKHIIERMEADDRAALGVSNSAETRAKAIAKDERELQHQIAGYLRLHRLWFTQSRMDRRTSNTVGTPDFLFPYKGKNDERARWVAWEVKCPWSRSLRPEQAHARDQILAQGGEWRLITSLPEAQAHLREIDGIPPRTTQP